MLEGERAFDCINERFPHIGNRLKALWGQPAAGGLLEQLLRETRNTGRQGFPSDVIAAFNHLLDLHQGRRAGEFARPSQQPRAIPDTTVPPALAESEHFQAIMQRFPHIARTLGERWGTLAFSDYINDLFNDTRGDTRQGFPENISSALLKLMLQHDTLFPEDALRSEAKAKQDVWVRNFKVL